MRSALGVASALVLGLVLTGCASTGTTRTTEADGLTTGLPAAVTSTSAAPAPSGTEGPFGPEGPDASAELARFFAQHRHRYSRQKAA